MRWGLFGARADRRGLAVQTTEIARNLRPDRVLGLEMGGLSPLAPDWSDYDPTTLTVGRVDDLPRADAPRRDWLTGPLADWLSGLDVVFGCETFYRPWFTELAAAAGVATVLQVNPEFVGHVLDWPAPTKLVAPTGWRLDTIPGATVLPVGVARDRLPPRRRGEVAVVLHVIGHGAVHDRNGTLALLDALRHVRHPLAVVVRAQRRDTVPLGGVPRWVDVEVRCEDVPDYWRLYDEGDLLVLPRRYGGLCLPAQEALSTGMPVLMPDCPPNPDLLPPSMLVPVRPTRPGHHARFPAPGLVPLAETDPALLGARIDRLARNPVEVQALSAEADRIAAGLSWERVEPLYQDALADAATAVASRR